MNAGQALLKNQTMTQKLKDIDWKRVQKAAGPYPIEAFSFVREGLTFTAEQMHEHPEALAERDRHITGQQLCLGLRDFAIERYGLLAPVVLRHWHVLRTEDFGRIVFAMIQEGLMSRTDEDSVEDFRAVYDFDEAFARDALVSRIAVA
jgi:uncharacterized repeat protein (TIGR04138 family)